ncbi:MAG: dihydroorotate dehydrogenase-like protein [Bacteroidales bacterium]|nr:dihydroorotate dehydrogenase-like protein [Bacteroidales bacterium]
MSNLKTNYMGIELKNPIIVGASNLVVNHDHLKHLEDAGAGAIVYKSLFEEQVQLDAFFEEEAMAEFNNRNAEMITIYPGMADIGPQEFLTELRKAKEAVSIPLFASLNCVSRDVWLEYAKLIEQTGVDGLELNFYASPREFGTSGHDILEEQLKITNEIKESLKIPVAVKLSPYYTNTLRFVNMMEGAGADAVVLFNKLFQPNIDIETEKLAFDFNTSGKGDYRLSLRYMGLLYGRTDMSLVANTGIKDGKDVIKMILAGADAVQVVSALYQNGLSHIETMLKDMEEWMDKKGYKTLDDFRGKLAKSNLIDPFAYNRAQYVDALMKSVELYKPNKMV